MKNIRGKMASAAAAISRSPKAWAVVALKIVLGVAGTSTIFGGLASGLYAFMNGPMLAMPPPLYGLKFI